MPQFDPRLRAHNVVSRPIAAIGAALILFAIGCKGPAADNADDVELQNSAVTNPTTPVTKVPAHYRVPYEMFSFDGMSYEQISSRLGLPSRTVGTRINRARKRLRGLLQEGNYGI